MGYKIFVSYKYADDNVAPLKIGETSTARSYVDEIEKYFDKNTDNIYKGESDGEDLSDLSDDQIWELLKDRIYDSSVTIVLASPGMKDPDHRERSQWIPWEVSYSLRETTCNDRTSHSNAMVLIALPDKNGLYSYAYKKCRNCEHQCSIWDFNFSFKIIKGNVFNKKVKESIKCENGIAVYSGEPSYIVPVTWDMIKGQGQLAKVIDRAIEIQKNKVDYEVPVNV